MNTEQSEARIKEEQELRLTAFYADKVKRAQAKLWMPKTLNQIERKEREAAYRSLGLKKVKGAIGNNVMTPEKLLKLASNAVESTVVCTQHYGKKSTAKREVEAWTKLLSNAIGRPVTSEEVQAVLNGAYEEAQ